MSDTDGAVRQQKVDGTKPASPRPGATTQKATDIGDVKPTEGKLHQNEQALRRIIDLIPQTIVVLNPDGRVIYANRGALEYTGLSPDEMSADDSRGRVFHPEDVQRLREERQKAHFVSRTVFRWILVDWFPEQPVGLGLPKGFKIPHATEFDFDFEKQQLLKIVDAAWHARSPDDWGPHPMFGKMTLSEWGKLLQIHIDYHLKQFAA